MDKYNLLIILNFPFVVFGLLKAFTMYKENIVQRIGFLSRCIFWLLILGGLIFAEPLYSFLLQNNLTDTTPLSLADVLLVTGVMLALSLCIRLYSKVDLLEKRISDLHEKLSIENSKTS